MNKYDYHDSFNNGYSVARLGDKWGLIDQDYNEIVSPKYDFAWPICDNAAKVKLGNQWGYVDTNGNEQF